MALEKSKKDGTPPPDPEGVELRSREELENELERQKAKLDLNLNTNPGVVEQYEKRKRDVSDLLFDCFFVFLCLPPTDRAT